jgi:hypothetical protein
MMLVRHLRKVRKDNVMNTRDGWIGALALALALVGGTGMVWTDQYPAAEQAEVAGFDALAHGVFSGLKADPGQCQSNETVAQADTQ